MKRSRDEAEPSSEVSLDEPVGPFKSTGDADEEAGLEDVVEPDECIICFGELKVVGQLSSCVSRTSMTANGITVTQTRIVRFGTNSQVLMRCSRLLPQSHTCFCYDCILEWSKTENRCPCCRKRFTTLAKVDREAEGDNGKGKARKKPAPKVKIPSRDQGAAYAARMGGGVQWDAFGHDAFFQLASRFAPPLPPFAAPAMSDRRRAEPFPVHTLRGSTSMRSISEVPRPTNPKYVTMVLSRSPLFVAIYV